MTVHLVNDHQTTVKSQFMTTPQQIAVSSQLMQNYRLGTPFQAGSQIATAPNRASHQTEVFSIGNNGHIYNVYPDPDSDTGWGIVDLNFPRQATYIAAGANPDGSVIVYAADSNNILYSNIGGIKWGSGWKVLPSGLGTIRGLNVGYDKAQMPFFTLLTSNDVNVHILWLLTDYWHMISYTPKSVYGWCAAFIDTPDGTGSPGVYASVDQVHPGQPGVIAFVLKLRHEEYAPSTSGTFSAVSAAKNAQGYDELFAVSTQDSGVYAFTLNPIYVPTKSWFTSTKISGDTPISALAASSNSADVMEVFALGTDHYLYHVRQDPNSAIGWSPLLQLNQDLQFAHIVAERSPEGYSEAFAVTTGNTLYHIWQDPTTSDWHFDEVELPTSGTIEEISSYNLQVTVYDTNQVAAPMAAVKVFSEQPITLDINGVACFLDKDKPWQGETNAIGQVTITMPTKSLGIAPLAVWTSFMPPNDRVALDASGPIQAELAAVDANQLLDAKVTDDQGQQTPLIQGQANRDPQVVANLAQAVTRAMSLTNGSTLHNTAAEVSSFHRLTDRRVARYVKNHNGEPLSQIHVPSVEEQHWQVYFGSGKPVFHELTREDATLLIAAKQSLPQAASFLGWDSWGDVFDAIKEGIASIVHFVVSTVKKGIQVVFTLVIKGVQYVYNAVINLIEQTFDLVEEIFKAVAVKFEQLFRWLGFIFNWDDILRSKEVIKYAFGQMFQFTESALAKIEKQVVGGINTFEQQVKQTFEEYINTMLGQHTTLAGFRQNHDQIPTQAEANFFQSAGLNVFQPAFINNVGKGPGMSRSNQDTLFTLSTEANSAIDALITQLSNYATQFESAEAFEHAIDYFSQIKNNPDQVLQLAMGGILSLCEGLVLLALDMTKVIVQILFDAILAALSAIETLLNAEWSVPFVSDLYEHIAKSKLTTLDLFSILIATPATILYKLTFNAAPFPDAAAVQAFETYFTSTALLQRSGLSESSRARQTLQVQDESKVQLVFEKFFQACYSINSLLFIAPDILIDLESVTDGLSNKMIEQLNTMALVQGWLSWVFGGPWVAWIAEGGAPGCDSDDEFEKLVALLQIIGNGIDTAWFVFEKKTTGTGRIARNSGDLGLITSSLWGCTGMGLTITWAVKNDGKDGLGIAEGIIGGFPGCVKWLGYKKLVVVTEGISLAVLGVTDAVCDTLAALLSVNQFATFNNTLEIT